MVLNPKDGDAACRDFFQFNYQTPTHLLSGDNLHIIASMQKVVNKKIKKIFWKKF